MISKAPAGVRQSGGTRPAGAKPGTLGFGGVRDARGGAALSRLHPGAAARGGRSRCQGSASRAGGAASPLPGPREERPGGSMVTAQVSPARPRTPPRASSTPSAGTPRAADSPLPPGVPGARCEHGPERGGAAGTASAGGGGTRPRPGCGGDAASGWPRWGGCPPLPVLLPYGPSPSRRALPAVPGPPSLQRPVSQPRGRCVMLG